MVYYTICQGLMLWPFLFLQFLNSYIMIIKNGDNMNIEAAEFIHRQIILDLTIRTLERERKHLNELKMKVAFELWMDKSIKDLKELLKNVKSQLGRQGIKIQSEVKEDIFTVYTVLDKGKAYERRYNNIALRNWCEEEVKRLLGLEYRTNEDGMKPPPSR